MLIQELWLVKIEWDKPLSPELRDKWNNFREQLPELSRLSIPRWLHISSTVHKVELHGFADASQLAMAAVIYVRVVTNMREVIVRLVCAKTKVAPLKRLTIPRLELTAALLLARLVSQTRALELHASEIFMWTDSTVTLTWLSAHPSRWKDFVRNRVTTIQELTPSAKWQFVSGKENPADCASRGIRANQLEHHPLWWTGPLWLNKASSEWPTQSMRSDPEADLEERAGQVLIASCNTRPDYWDLLDRYSSVSRLLRITAICRRAADRFKQTDSSAARTPITPLEQQQSSHFWIQQVQHAYFGREIEILSHGGHLSRTNHLIRLTSFLDKFGLLRVGGRLQKAALDPDFKHPSILPRRSPYTTLIIADAHQRTLHGGTQVTMAYIRQTYWIIGGPAPIRSYILRCVRCARYRGIRAQQLMGQLPTPRITPSRPFLHTGIDYAGPLCIKTWRGRAAKTYKGYLAIFVCFSTSAVHLEIVTDYSTEAFIAAYKRFTARRGICAALYSDCGTNFVRADTALRQRFDAASDELKELATILATHGTAWKFNPPSAPHFGGKWEAAVKSTKFHLRRTIGDTILTYEELSTLLTQIEAILNSRPLPAFKRR